MTAAGQAGHRTMPVCSQTQRMIETLPDMTDQEPDIWAQGDEEEDLDVGLYKAAHSGRVELLRALVVPMDSRGQPISARRQGRPAAMRPQKTDIPIQDETAEIGEAADAASAIVLDIRPSMMVDWASVCRRALDVRSLERQLADVMADLDNDNLASLSLGVPFQ